MGVINQIITDSANLLTHPQMPGQVRGQRVLTIQKRIAVAAADSAGSQYLICLLDDTAIVDDIDVEVAASLATAADNDIGLYDLHGNVKDVDYYSNGLDLTAAGVSGVAPFGGKLFKGAATRGGNGQAAYGQQVWQDAGDVAGPFPAAGSTLKCAVYQLIWTMNTAEAAAKDVLFTVRLRSTP